MSKETSARQTEGLSEVMKKGAVSLYKTSKLTPQQRLKNLVEKEKAKDELNADSLTQYAIGVVPPVGFIQKLPKRITVESLCFRSTHNSGRRKLNVPAYLRKIGLTTVSEVMSHIEIRGTFKDVAHSRMISGIQQISRTYKVPIDRLFIERVTVVDNKENSITFDRIKKNIKTPNDQRRKKIVLSLVSHQGKDWMDILHKLQATKYTCLIATVSKRLVVCDEASVTK